MGHQPLVSIIVPVYGTEMYLPDCIESLRGQTYTNIQIILVDDESPDRCPEICDDYAKQDCRIKVIHQANKGVSGARNTGMEQAEGDFIMFVDSDDELYPDAVADMLQDAEKYEADVVSAMKKVVGRNGKTITDHADGKCQVYCDEQSVILSLDGDRNTNSACAKLFKSSFINGIRFEEGKNIHEDGFFVFQCYLRKPILVQHNISVYQYNVRENSGSRQAFSDKYLSVLYFARRKIELILEQYPHLILKAHNMQVRVNLQFLELLCRTKEKKYKALQKECICTVRKLYAYHNSINDHHKKLAWLVVHGLYPLYKLAVRIKYKW